MIRTSPVPHLGSRADSGGRAPRHVLMTLAVFVVSMAVLYVEAQTTPFEGDESFYTATSRYFGYLFLQRDVTRAEWDDNYMTRTQPPLTRYIVGAWLTGWGYDLETLNQPYVSTARSVEINRQKGRVPDDLVLAQARQPMVLLGAGAIALLYPLGVLLGGTPAGLVAAGLALSSPFLRYTFVHAWAEAPLAFFLTASLLLAALGARHGAAGGRWFWWSAALGLTLGLAMSAKLTGGLGMAIVGGWSAAALGYVILGRLRPRVSHSSEPPDRAARSMAIGGVLAVAIALVLFVVVNPFLWRGPLAGTVAMLQQRALEISEQQRQWPEYAVLTAAERPFLTLVGSLRFGPWAESWPGVATNLVLVAVGLGWLARAARRCQAPPGGWLATALLASWLACFFVAVAAGLGLSYPRYFLPSCMAMLPFAGLGAAVLAERAGAWASDRMARGRRSGETVAAG
jgi:hypothetical protein